MNVLEWNQSPAPLTMVDRREINYLGENQNEGLRQRKYQNLEELECSVSIRKYLDFLISFFSNPSTV